MVAAPKRLLSLRIVPALVAGVLACSEPIEPDRVRMEAVTIQANTVDAVAGIVVEVSGTGISPSLVVNLAWDSGLSRWTGTLDVPVGEDRTFRAQAFDSVGTVTHEGSATTDIVAGANGTVAVTLHSLTGSVPIEVVLGSIAIAPTDTTVAPGATAPFTGTYAGGSCPSTQRFASKNPGLATVDANGLATAGSIPGEVTIVFTCKGLAAAATLTIQ